MQGRSKKATTNSSISALPAQGQGGASNFRLFVIFSLIILFVIGGAYSYFKMIKTMEFSATKLFEEAFVEPATSVTNLSGNSKGLLGFDSWIRFKSTEPVHLKNASDFKPYISEVGRTTFADRYPNDHSLEQPVNTYEYSIRMVRTVDKIVHEGLLINKTKHEYFYRKWGM